MVRFLFRTKPPINHLQDTVKNLGGTQTSCVRANELGKQHLRSLYSKGVIWLPWLPVPTEWLQSYAADHKDIVINVLPQALNRRILQCTSKSGIMCRKRAGATPGNAAIAAM